MDAQGAELLALVYAYPHVDEHRLVYADWLQARGDPRGEFIALQFKRADGRAEPGRAESADIAREEVLLQAHGQRWLGALASALEPATVKYRKGFLWSARALEHDPHTLTRIADAPEWATVEILAGPPEVLRLPALRALRSLGARDLLMSPEPVTALHRQDHRLPQVTEAHFGPLADWNPQRSREVCAVLPGLRHLELVYRSSDAASWNDFQPAGFADLLTPEPPTALRTLRIRKWVQMSSPRWRDFTEARPDLHAWSRACRQATPSVREVHLEPCDGWAFGLVRDDADRPWTLTIDWDTTSASADPKTLELAISRVRRSDFAGVRAHIHGLARPRHRKTLERLLSGFRPVAIDVHRRRPDTSD